MVWRWSKTASSNSNADSTINWAEGMAPSAVNDSARAEMARVAQWRDDISGAITTGGTSSAFTVTSNQSFDTLAHMDGMIIAFVPHATAIAAPTLSVDGLTAKKIRFQTGADIPDGVLIQGTPYTCTYYNSIGEFILHNMAGNPYSIPLGGGLDYWGATAPNSAFAFPSSQAISRTTYATLFSLFGTTYGSGDGSTTFNLPDKRGRVSAGKDDMNAAAANRITNAGSGITGTTLGASNGTTETVTIAQGNLPAISPTFSGTNVNLSLNSTSSAVVTAPSGINFTGAPGGSQGTLAPGGQAGQIQVQGSYTPAGTISALGSGFALNNCQPTIICNYLIRII